MAELHISFPYMTKATARSRLRTSRIRFRNDAFSEAIAKAARKHGGDEKRVRDHLQAELVRVGISARLDRLLQAGGPSVETLFVLARALRLPMEHFIEEVA